MTNDRHLQGEQPDSAPIALVSCTGIATFDTIFGVDELPSGDGKWSAAWITETGGGVAANAAVAVARLGGRARFIGSVGDDRRGQAVRQGLVGEGVLVDGLHTIDRSTTPTSAVVVDPNGGRMVVNHVSDGFFDRAEARWARSIGSPDAVLVDLRWLAGATESVRAASSAGIPSVVDVDRPVDPGAAILVEASHLLFSADALHQMTGIAEPSAALHHTASSTPAWIGVTLGPRGVAWVDGSMCLRLPAHEVRAVDTLGAGDTFHGAFALGLAEGLTESEALGFANAVAAVKCQSRGGRSGIPSRATVLRFLQCRRAPTPDQQRNTP